MLKLRKEPSKFKSVLCCIVSILFCFGIWYYVTLGENESRILTSNKLPSPYETYKTIGHLLTDGSLSQNILISFKRVSLGFLVAVSIGVPLGIICGCFPIVNVFFFPQMMFCHLDY